MNEACLGLSILGGCSYDPSSPAWRIISLGDAIAAISLLIAFSQLLTPILKIRISRLFPKVYVLWGFAAISILISSLLPFFPGHAWPLLGYPIFWELVGSTLILVSVGALLFSFSRPLKFSKRSFRSTMRLVTRGIATGEEKDYAELAFSLQRILGDLISAVARYDSFEKEMARRDGKAYSPPAMSVEAGRILQLCSDERFCAAVVRREPGFAVGFFEEIKKHNACHNGFIKPLAWELVRQALLHPDSILYREKRYKGLGFNASFTHAAFSDNEINEWVQPLSGYRFILEKEVTIEALDRYGEIVEILAQTYLKTGRFYEHSFSIYSTFNALTDYAGYISSRVDASSPDDLYRSHTYSSLDKIGSTITDLIGIFAKEPAILDGKLVEYWKGVERNRDYSPFEYLAKLIYEFMEALSHTRKYDEALRMILIRPWLEIYPVSQEGVFHQELQWRLEEKLFEKLKVNLEEGYYPAVSRPLLSVLSLHEQSNRDGDSRLRTRLFAYLRQTFSTLYAADKERALDKLPASMTYDPDKVRLVQHVRKGDERVLELLPGNPK